MPCIESKFDSRTLTPYCFSNALISFGSMYSDQLKYTRSPSGSALTTFSVGALAAPPRAGRRRSPRHAQRRARARRPPRSSSRRAPSDPSSCCHSPRSPARRQCRRTTSGRHGGIAQRELDREPIHQRAQQEREVLGVVLPELAARLTLADHVRDRRRASAGRAARASRASCGSRSARTHSSIHSTVSPSPSAGHSSTSRASRSRALPSAASSLGQRRRRSGRRRRSAPRSAARPWTRTSRGRRGRWCPRARRRR